MKRPWRGKLDTNGKIGIALVLGILFAIGLPMVNDLRAMVYAHDEQTWRVAHGQIRTMRVEEMTTTGRSARHFWYPVWTYTYFVDGTPYRASSTDLARHHQVSEFGSAAAAAAFRPVDTDVDVYYDPDAPQRSVLDPLDPLTRDDRSGLFEELGAIAMVVCIVWMLLGMARKR